MNKGKEGCSDASLWWLLNTEQRIQRIDQIGVNCSDYLPKGAPIETGIGGTVS